MRRISVVMALLGLVGCSYWVNGPIVTVPPATVSPATETRGPTEVPSATREPEPSTTPEHTTWPTPTQDALEAEYEATVLGGTPWGTAYPKFNVYGIAYESYPVGWYYNPYSVLNVRKCKVGYFWEHVDGRDPKKDCARVDQIGKWDNVNPYFIMKVRVFGSFEWSEWLCLNPVESHVCDRVVIYRGEDGTVYGDLYAQEVSDE